MNAPINELPMEAVTALEKGNKIEAIKIVRAAHNLDLKDSKDAVELYLKNNPALEQRFNEIQKESSSRVLFWVMVFIFAVAAYLFFTGKI